MRLFDVPNVKSSNYVRRIGNKRGLYERNDVFRPRLIYSPVDKMSFISRTENHRAPCIPVINRERFVSGVRFSLAIVVLVAGGECFFNWIFRLLSYSFPGGDRVLFAHRSCCSSLFFLFVCYYLTEQLQ